MQSSYNALDDRLTTPRITMLRIPRFTLEPKQNINQANKAFHHRLIVTPQFESFYLIGSFYYFRVLYYFINCFHLVNMFYLSMFTFCRDLGTFARKLREGHFGHQESISLVLVLFRNLEKHFKREREREVLREKERKRESEKRRERRKTQKLSNRFISRFKLRLIG